MMHAWRRSMIATLFAAMLPMLGFAQAEVNVSVNVAPPELPVYDQPPIPGDGYIWTPGFWAWSDDIQDYYWTPGTWVEAPEPGYLWTPGFWGFAEGVYLWHAGYWGPHVGFYGGVNYGYGYGGSGYEGGYWQNGRLFYNRSVNNISNVRVTNVYNKTVVNDITVNRVSYNGGNGVHAQPNAEQQAASHDRHIEVTSAQRQHDEAARSDPALRHSQNQGRPPVAATSRPGAFSGAGVVGTRGGARPGGTMSVVHPQNGNAAPRGDAQQNRSGQQQDAARQQQDLQRQQQQQAQGEQQRRQQQRVQEQRPQEQRPQEQRPQEHQNAPPPQRPAAPHPAEHPPEHGPEH